MILAQCIEAVTKAAGRELTQDEVKQLSTELDRRAREAQAGTTALSYEDAALKAADEIGKQMELAAAIEKRNAALNLRRRTEALAFIRESFRDDPALGLQSLLTGTQRARVGARRSVAAEQEQLRGYYLAGLLTDLEKTGALPLLTSGAADRDIARALWRLDDEKPEFTGLQPEAVELAKAIRKWQDVARLDANKAGAWIGKLPGYVVRQSHDMWKIREAGFDQWKSDILPKLDLDETLKNLPTEQGPPDVNGWLREVYTGLATGQHLKSGPDQKAGAFKGPANLAKRLSQDRTLHFKDADSWADYNAKYGAGNLREALFHGMTRAADSTGLMRVLGTNPGSTFDQLVDKISKELRRDPEALVKFANEVGTTQAPGAIRNRLAQVDGSTRIPVNQMLARASSTFRGVETMAKLGGSMISSFSDVPVYASEMKYQGKGFLSGMAEALGGLLEGRPAGERKEILSSLGVVFDHMVGDITRFGAHDDSVPGRLSRMQQTFFKLNLQSWWTDSLLSSAALSMSHDLGQHMGKTFADLRPELQRALGLYGVTEREWNALTGVEARTADDGRAYLTPEAARLTSNDAVDEVIADRIAQINQSAAAALKRAETVNTREREWVTKRAAKLREDLRAATVRLNERVTALDAKTAAGVADLQMRISRLEEILEYAQSYWNAPQSEDVPGIRGGVKVNFYGKRFLRDLGIGEGRARESIKELAAEARTITRETERFKQQLGEDFVAKWKQRQDDLVAFAEGVDERSSAREAAAQEYARAAGDRIEKARAEFREQLEGKLRSFFLDRTKTAVLHPDAETMALMRQGTRPGTVVGEAARFIGQFKSFSISYLQKIVGREIYGRGSDTLLQAMRNGHGEMLGLANIILWTTAFGYGAMVTKDLLKGRNPRDPENYKTWMAALAQGGGMGIYGDFLFGETNRMGGGLWSSALGPVAGATSDLYDLYQRAKSGDDVAAQALRVGIQNTPFLNLFYTRTVLDYLILYRIQEAMNPGYLRRLEHRVERDNAQTFWLRPTEVAQ